jgi:hypothetical protein
MGYNLFIDDYRMPKDAFAYLNLPQYITKEWIVVRNYYAFITIIQNKGIPDSISFDHDLADAHYKNVNFNYNDENMEKTGYHCALWLINYCMDNNKKLPAEILIHSMNPAGSLNIKSLFESYKKSLIL